MSEKNKSLSAAQLRALADLADGPRALSSMDGRTVLSLQRRGLAMLHKPGGYQLTVEGYEMAAWLPGREANP